MGGCLLLLTACGSPLEGADFSSRGPATSEPGYYGKPTDYSSVSTVKIRAIAKFKYRALSFSSALGNKNTTNGLSSTFGEAGIPYAEFHIYDNNGQRIQQGETKADGTVEFYIPKVAGIYNIRVFSRADNNYLKVSVLEDIYSNQPYSVVKVFSISEANASSPSFGTEASPYDSGTFYAQGNESLSSKIEGGAFNIMHKIYLANVYIRDTIGKNNPSDFTNKDAWWVADKVTAYWKAGFNPYSYFDSKTTTLLSFYSPGESKLYILGGTNGNVKTADTDHFDNSVILHEYGHFLEDRYGFSSSPGGSHNGDFVIDARLAWSEGWANYFQAAVRSHAVSSSEGEIPASEENYFYIDTYGYKSSTSSDSLAGISIAFNLKQDASLATFDRITEFTRSGEGVFREVSIARSLYKITRKANLSYAATKNGGGISFADIWKTFSGEDTIGHNRSTSILANSLRNAATYPVPNVGLFNRLLKLNTATNTTNMGLILDEEKSLADESEYGVRVTPQVAACASRMMYGTSDSTLIYPRSNQFRNNDFFVYQHNGSSNTIDLLYKRVSNCSNSSCNPDLDLVVYRLNIYSPYIYFEDYWRYDSSYSYYKESSLVYRQSRRAPALEGASGEYRTESVSMSGAPAGLYLINVKLNSYGKVSGLLDGTLQYDLKIGSSYLCP